MKFKLLLLCFAAVFITGNAQAQSSASLLAQIQKSKADTGKVKLLLALSRSILLKSGAAAKEIDSSYRFMKQAEQLSVQLEDIKGQGHTALMAAMISNKKGDYKTGADLAQKGFDFFKSINDQPGMAEAYIIIGQHYTNDNDADVDKKIAYYKKAIDIFLKAGVKERAATTMTDLGDLLTLQGKYEESVKYLRDALNLYRGTGFKDLQGLYDLLGTNLTYLGDVDNALKYELDAIRLAEAHKDTSLQMCTIYNRLALSYYTQHRWNPALTYFYKALSIAKKYKDTASITVIIGNQAMVYYKLHQPANALVRLNTLKSYASQFKEPFQKIENYYSYCLVYIDLKQYKLAKVYLDKMDMLFNVAGTQTTEIYRGHISYHIATGEYKKAYAYL